MTYRNCDLTGEILAYVTEASSQYEKLKLLLEKEGRRIIRTDQSAVIFFSIFFFFRPYTMFRVLSTVERSIKK